MKRIISERALGDSFSRHIVFEWEDEFSKFFHTEIGSFSNKLFFRLTRKFKEWFFSKVSFRVTATRWHLAFIMHPGMRFVFFWWSIIPIYLDVERKDIESILHQTKCLPCYFVTTKDVFDIIKENNPQAKCYYMSHSIPDKYIDLTSPPLKCRKIDLIQLGRKNARLHEFALRYCEEHRDVNYVYFSHQDDCGNLIYTSTIWGDLGQDGSSFPSRESLMQAFQNSKISLVSTPGQDGSRDFGLNLHNKQIDFFTARFYECCACHCYMIGKYTENEECKILDIPSICPNISEYSSFEQLTKAYLSSEEFLLEKEYQLFLEKNVTSKRAKFVADILDECGLTQ